MHEITYPDSVSRVNPPNTIIPNTLAALPRSQYETLFEVTEGNRDFVAAVSSAAVVKKDFGIFAVVLFGRNDERIVELYRIDFPKGSFPKRWRDEAIKLRLWRHWRQVKSSLRNRDFVGACLSTVAGRVIGGIAVLKNAFQPSPLIAAFSVPGLFLNSKAKRRAGREADALSGP